MEINENLLKALNKIFSGEFLSKKEVLKLLNIPTEELIRAANSVRKHLCNESFDICTIINAKSGACSENCKFCSQSSHFNTASPKYDMLSQSEIIEDARYNEQKGVLRYSLVTSGRKLSKTEVDKVCQIYTALSKTSNMALCASHGLLEYEDLKKLYKAGVVRYHNNLESSRSFFPKVCSTHIYEDKLKTIRAAQEAGLKVCSGGIIGLGETMEDRIDMAFELRTLGIKSVPINILNPISGTPFGENKVLSEDEILKTIAIFRFILPDAVIRLAGGRGLLKDKGRRAFASGINGAITGDMLTTSGTNIDMDKQMIAEAGFVIEKRD
ncbi:MAG: biotin synthase BioB [Proteocatella sp.]